MEGQRTFEMVLRTSEQLYQPQRTRESFKHWLFREYSHSGLTGHPFWTLALEIEAKWPDFPEQGTYLELALWLGDHGACNTCKNAFRDAWENYINDG